MQALNELLDSQRTSGRQHSPDPEVSFDPPEQSETSIDFEPSESEEVDMAQERRLQLLESAVIGMSDKFDAVLNAFASPSPPQAVPPDEPVHRQPRQRTDGGQHENQRASQQRTMPAQPRQPGFAAFVAEQLQKEDFSVPKTDDGKALSADMYINNPHPKPYMYIQRPGVNTLKKKLDARESMTFNEYVFAFLKMTRDPRANLTEDMGNLLLHLQQVAEDSILRDWSATRRWSQATFDAIERGDYTWADRQEIQFERLHHAIPQARPQYTDRSEKLDRRDLPCRDFNSVTGCLNPKSHLGRNVTFAHICSVCFNQTGEKAPHSATVCPRAGRAAPAVSLPLPRYQQTAPQYQPPKNAMGAPMYKATRPSGSNTML